MSGVLGFFRLLWALLLRFFGVAPNVPLPPKDDPIPVDPTDPMPSPLPKPQVKLTSDLSDGFFLGAVKMGKNLKTDPRTWFAVSAYEGDGMRASASNPAGAYGLIQFTEAARNKIGWKGPMSDIAKLSAEAQLPLIERYYADAAPYKSAGEVYGETFLPGRMKDRGRAPDTVLTVSPETFYTDNASLDANKDGRITIADLEATTQKAIARMGARWTEVMSRLAWAESVLGTDSTSYIVPIVVAGVAIGLFVAVLNTRG